MTTEFPKAINVPVNSKPTMFNEEALEGAVIGNVVGGSGDGELIGTLAGGAIGGIVGKERMEREYQEGRVVHAPGSMGGSILGGILIGGVLAGIIGAMAFVGSGIAIAAVVGAVVGAMVGYGKHKQAVNEYEAAKAYYAEYGGQYQGREHEMQRAQDPYTVTPEEYQLLQDRLSAGENGNRSDRHLAGRHHEGEHHAGSHHEGEHHAGRRR